jgi:cell division septum initiation protein DivIVA
MEKEMPRDLDTALQEIRQLRQENAQLRKKLGMEVSEPKAGYSQSGPTSVGSNTTVDATSSFHSQRLSKSVQLSLP